MTSEEPNGPQVYLLGKVFLANSQGQFYIKNDPIVELACGDQHTIIVTQTGRAFAFGDNQCGQLGLGHSDKVDKVSCIKSLKFSDSGDKVSLAACGREHSVVATAKGALYSFGSNAVSQLGIDTDKHKSESTESKSSLYTKPIKITSLPPNIVWKQLAAGAEHVCALTKTGNVYVWGSNADGQCGLSKKEHEIKYPQELKLPYRVTAVACGYYHTALISDEGRLYTFGNNSDHQLGRSLSEKQPGPQLVSLPDHPSVKTVACGHQHTAVLTENGTMLVCGNGDRGQLGLGPSLLSTEQFEQVEAFDGKKVTAIACGESHTVAIVNKGDLYVFGDGKHGKLGAKVVTNEFSPKFVEKFHHYQVLKVACGGLHTILVAERKPTANSKHDLESDDALESKTLSGTQLEKSIARENRIKSKNDLIGSGGGDTFNRAKRSQGNNNNQLTMPASSQRTASPEYPRKTILGTEPAESGNESNDEFSSSLKSATFNATHTLTNGKFKPSRPLGNSNDFAEKNLKNNSSPFMKTGILDHTAKLQKVPSDQDTSDQDLKKTTLPALNASSMNKYNNDGLKATNNNNSNRLSTTTDYNRSTPMQSERNTKLSSTLKNINNEDDDDESKPKLRQIQNERNRFNEESPILKSKISTDNSLTYDKRLQPLKTSHELSRRSPDISPNRTKPQRSTKQISNEDGESSEEEMSARVQNNKGPFNKTGLNNNNKLSTSFVNKQQPQRSPDIRRKQPERGESEEESSEEEDDDDEELSKHRNKVIVNNKQSMSQPPTRKMPKSINRQDSSDEEDNEIDKRKLSSSQMNRRGSLPISKKGGNAFQHGDGSQTISGRPVDGLRSSFKQQTPATKTLAKPLTTTPAESTTTTQQPGFFARLFHRSGSASTPTTATSTPVQSAKTPIQNVKTPATSSQQPGNTTAQSRACIVM